jgi:hypothetical protein
MPLTAAILGVAANFAFLGGVLDEVLGGILIVGAVGAVVILFRYQRRLIAAISDWFGVKISSGQLPIMSPGRFDSWCERVDLHGQARPDGARPLEPLRLKYDHAWGPVRWSGSKRRDPSDR